MTTRIATCQCGALSVTCAGEPVRISVCHCLACQKRSGAPLAAQARFATDCVEMVGEDKIWTRVGDAGSVVEHHFCPKCGSTVWYTLNSQPDLIAVAVGAFADPAFPAPGSSNWEERRLPWVAIVGEGVAHHD